ncbi:hypothetical protein GW17_00025119 [Ensete ventricosum]|nr:hypothetical protein GW17_00025119 [Ensete ventricosum]RZS06982.1 hypothetical protein BHM03_00037729 [Ensete ventricosum]
MCDTLPTPAGALPTPCKPILPIVVIHSASMWPLSDLLRRVTMPQCSFDSNTAAQCSRFPRRDQRPLQAVALRCIAPTTSCRWQTADESWAAPQIPLAGARISLCE